MTKNIYYTHYNGGRPYKVIMEYKNVSVYKFLHRTKEKNKIIDTYENTPICKYKALQIFVGKSIKNNMTKFSGGTGFKFDGNSILLNINNLTYIYIGKSIYKFNALNKIITYVSPIGNSDVPYPYAIDIDGNIYLINDNKIIINNIDLIENMINSQFDDPYSLYYNICNKKKCPIKLKSIKTKIIDANIN